MKSRIAIYIAILSFCLPFFGAAQGSFKLPAYEKFKLKNGLTVYLMEQHEVPMINFRAVFKAGSIYDGKQSGLASMTADGLMFGTKNYEKEQIEEILDFHGASIRTWANKEGAFLNLQFSLREQGKIWDILRELLSRPMFGEADFEKRKKRKLAELDQARESPRSVINAYWDKFLYGDHAYGNPNEGLKSSIEAMSRQDLKDFHTQYYNPGNAAIALVGDFNARSMKEHLQTLLAKWTTKGAKPKATTVPNMTYTEAKVLLVNKGDSRETRFLIGGKGVPRKHADYVGIQVINTILGGRFTSWLNAELRINSGLSYGARSRFYGNKVAGTFAVSSFTKTSTTVEAIDLALKVLDSLHVNGPDEVLLLSARKYIKGSFPPKYESSGQLVSLLGDFFLYDLNESYINDFEKQVDAMTVKRAKEIIAKYFPKENLQFLLVGKAEDIRDGIRKYGPIEQKEITADGF